MGENYLDCFENDPCVEDKVSVLDVVQIVLKLFL